MLALVEGARPRRVKWAAIEWPRLLHRPPTCSSCEQAGGHIGSPALRGSWAALRRHGCWLHLRSRLLCSTVKQLEVQPDAARCCQMQHGAAPTAIAAVAAVTVPVPRHVHMTGPRAHPHVRTTHVHIRTQSCRPTLSVFCIDCVGVICVPFSGDGGVCA